MSSRLIANISSLLASEIARRILGFLSVAVMARALGVEGFGIIMIGLTVLSYISIGGSAGLHVLGTRNVARGDADNRLGEIVGVRLLNTLIAVIVANAVSFVWVADSRTQEVILLTSLSGFLHALFLEWFFQGRERMSEAALARTIGAVVYLAILFVGVRSPEDLRRAAIAAVIGDLASTGYLLARYRQTAGALHITLSRHIWSSLMRQAFPFGAGSVLGHLSINLPVLIVAALLGPLSAGVYSGASKLVFFLLMADRILGTVLLPASVRLHTHSREYLHDALQKTLRWIIIIGLPLGIGGMLLGTRIVTFVLGQEFSESGVVFGILVWYVVLTMLHTVYTNAVMAAGGENDYRRVMVISAITYAICATGGAMEWGVLGASTGVIVAEGLTVTLMARAARRYVGRFSPPGLARVVTASTVCAVAILLFPSLHLILLTLVGLLSYITASAFLRTMTLDDVRHIVGRLRTP